MDKGRSWASQEGLYTTRSWRILRAEVLKDEPFCRTCKKMKLRTPATMVDHIKPVTIHNWIEIFLDRSNLQPLCEACHQFKTNRDKIKHKIKKVDMNELLAR